MGDTWNDATQSYENENGVSTAISIVDNNDLLTPSTTNDANFLIRLVDVDGVNQLYILQANENGEIRFLTAGADANNDTNGLVYNTKIGSDGRLYYYHSYNIFNPTKLSGWYELDGDITNIDQQLILLDIGLGTTTAQAIATQNALITTNANVALNTEGIATGSAYADILTGRITALEDKELSDATDLEQYIGPDAEELADALENRTLSNYEAQHFTEVLQEQKSLFTAKYGSLIREFLNKAGGTIGLIGLIASVYAGIKKILDDNKKKSYEEELLRINDSLGNLPISATNKYLIHTGITITSGNTGFTTAGVYRVNIQRSAVLVINISSSFVASILNVEQYGISTFTIAETINITKAQLGGGTGGNLVLSVASLGTLKTWTELRSSYITQKIDGLETKSRRKLGVIGADDIDTTQFTTTNVSYTNTTETDAETITYKQLKSRLNLLPTGISDIDVYTSTGQVGIGTAPATKLHTYHATDNILRLETATSGTNSIEFRRGTATDVFTDYRLISSTGLIRLQYENNLLAYGASGTELITSSTTLTTIFKNTSFTGNVGINVAPHATYKLDVAGDINISTGSLFKINGSAYKPAEATLADTATDLATGSILGTGKGGTGASSHTAGNLILGNGSGALTSASGLNYVSGTTTFNAPNVNVPTGGKYKINSVDLALSDLTGTLAIGKGGTGATSFTADGLLIGNGTTALTQNAGLFYTTATSRLTAGNVNVPTGGKYKINGVDLALSDLTGTLAVGNGGTGATTFTANGLIVGNGTTALTQPTGLTFSGTTLNAPIMNVASGGKYKINNVDLSYNDLANKLTPLAGGGITINANNEISSSAGTAYTGGNGITITGASIAVSGVITQLITTGSIDMLTLQNNATNSLRVKQNFIATNDFTYNLIQKNNNVDYPAFTFKNGQVAVGTTNVPTYALDVAGDINITGEIRKLSALYKPAGAVLADTATDLATGAILSIAKGGTGANTFTAGRLMVGNGTSALQTYTGLTYTSGTTTLNTPIIAVSGTSTLTGNVGIGTAPSATKLDVLGDVNIVGKTTQKGNIECLTLNPATPTIPAVLSIIPAPAFTFTPASAITRCAVLTFQGVGTGTAYQITIPAGGMLCDILMVGGGGSGGKDIGAGGGGGAVLYATNVLLKQDTYMVFVGRGAIDGSGEVRGQSTTGFGATLLGGGTAGNAVWASATYANDGGGGGGGKSAGDEWTKRGGRPIVGGSTKGGILSDGTLYEGSVGGYGVQQVGQVCSSGGGGAGAVGGNGGTSGGSGGTATGVGGMGISNTILDATYFWGGGGGGGSYSYTTASSGGLGGGGAGQNNNGGGITSTGSNGASSWFAVGTITNGINGTGGGGGGTGYTTQTAGSGGAGVIIIRYKLPTNHNQTITYLPTGTNGTITYKEGMIGANYKIEASLSSVVVDAFVVDNLTATTSIKNSAIVVKSATNDTLITNKCGIGIDPTSAYRLNVNGDLNVNGTIWQNGFSVNAGFQQYRTFNFTYSGDTNFLLTTRARYCNIVCWVSSGSGMIVSNGANMAVNEFRGSLGFSMTQSNATSYFFYWTQQGDNPRPFKAWFGNGSNTTFTFIEMWYN